MLTHSIIKNQIMQLTSDLISISLSENQNYPSEQEKSGNIVELGVTHADNSIFLKRIPYPDMYNILIEKRSYNIKMIDGALLTMLYRFKAGKIYAHRLSYFPAPDLAVFQNEPDLYLEDEIYLDVIDKRVVTVPLRFDYDSNPETFRKVIHPISHFTLGQYENCRIPVSSALTPYQFIEFILMNFYNTAYHHYHDQLHQYKDKFDNCIFPEERTLMHINTPL